MIKRRIGHFTAASWLDGAIGGLAAAALGTALLAPALVGLTKGDAPAVLTNLAYPLGDVLLVSFILGALVVSGFRGAGAFLAIIAGADHLDRRQTGSTCIRRPFPATTAAGSTRRGSSAPC